MNMMKMKLMKQLNFKIIVNLNFYKKNQKVEMKDSICKMHKILTQI